MAARLHVPCPHRPGSQHHGWVRPQQWRRVFRHRILRSPCTLLGSRSSRSAHWCALHSSLAERLSSPLHRPGLTSYTTPAHIALATLEANAFQTRAILESMALDSHAELKHLKVDGGMTNGDMVMKVLADVGGFEVIRPEMRESTALGSALLAGSAIRLFGWDISKPDTLAEVNTKGSTSFSPNMPEADREKRWAGWKRAVERARAWEEGKDE